MHFRLSLFIFPIFIFTSLAKERPNILWITSEDNASHWLGCYGNKDAQTPHLDAFAARSTRFTASYSNAPVCAVARSTIIMGLYAPAMGTQHMRSRHPIPSELIPYVTHLRKAGYYTTNASKTDYNFKGNDKALWDDSSKKASYKNRPDGTPFFSVINVHTSHESSLFPPKIKYHLKRQIIPQQTRLDPNQLTLPPYLPDLPEMRSDFAIYHDTMTALDSVVGRILNELEKEGLAEDTIVFYYSDHGGPTPRGKRYLHDTGVRVPMMIHVPQKWKHLSPFENGTTSDEIVSFVDLAPTLLSLVGLEDDPQMQGRPFMGPNREEPSTEPFAFLYADRFDEVTGLRRGLATKRYKYVRHFTPHTWGAPYSFYQFQMASWPAWHKAWKEGKLSEVHASLWENHQSVEELYDTEADPWEINNLANDPAHQERLVRLRQTLYEHMLKIRDTGIVPEPLFDTTRGDQPLMKIAQNLSPKDCENLLTLVFKASSGDLKNQETLKKATQHKNPIVRFWGFSGLVTLGKKADFGKEILLTGLEDPFPVISAQAATALHNIGQREPAIKFLQKKIKSDLSPTDEGVIINTFMQIHEIDAIPDSWFEKRGGKEMTKKFKEFGPRVYMLR